MLEPKELEQRISVFLEKFQRVLDLPLALQVVFHQFAPQIPKLLAEPEKQEELLKLMATMGWVIGYQAEFQPEEEEK